jgi:Fe-S-cluster containining protein
MDDWAQQIREAALRPEVRMAVEDLYAEVAGEIDRRRPVCKSSGRCCRFGEFGHRLYVTTMELAAFVHLLGGAAPAGEQGGQVCPFQVDGLCSVHAIRPFGCRIFFCDPTAGNWQREQYERFHARLRTLHEQLNVPYRYGEWLSALELFGLNQPSRKPAHALSLPQLSL